MARPWNLIVIAFSPYALRKGGFHIRTPRQQLGTGPSPHRVGRLFAPCGRSNNEQAGATIRFFCSFFAKKEPKKFQN